jgi:hypothetical protein
MVLPANSNRLKPVLSNNSHSSGLSLFMITVISPILPCHPKQPPVLELSLVFRKNKLLFLAIVKSTPSFLYLL